MWVDFDFRLAQKKKKFSAFANACGLIVHPEEANFILEDRNIVAIMDAYLTVQSQGGIVRVYHDQPDLLNILTSEQKQFYLKYFPTFENYKKKGNKNFLDIKYLEKACKIQRGELYDQRNFILDSLRKDQVTILKLKPEQLKQINEGHFDLESIKKNHGKQEVDIREQRVKFDSFNLSSFSQNKFTMTINEYVAYQLNPEKITEILKQKGIKALASDVLFAVNIDMDDWYVESNKLRQIMPEVLYCSEDDGLSYLRQHVQGVTRPQVYMKVKDVFTGGHQENLCLTAININHGPASSIWITVDEKYVKKLRQIVLEETKIDILKEEGLWFRDVEYFLEKKIPVKYTIQEAGDIILLGPGCLHWVKSEGVTVQSAWNFMLKDISQAKLMYERLKINKEINKETVVPLKNLFIDIYNHERYILPSKLASFLKEKIIEFVEEDKKKMLILLEKLGKHLKQIEYRSNALQVSLCSNCWHEIFQFFYMMEGDKQGGEYDFYCLNCMEKEILKAPKGLPVVFMKYKPLTLSELTLNEEYKQCYDSLCFNQYVGMVICQNQYQKTGYTNETQVTKIRKREYKTKSEKDEKKEFSKQPSKDFEAHQQQKSPNLTLEIQNIDLDDDIIPKLQSRFNLESPMIKNEENEKQNIFYKKPNLNLAQKLHGRGRPKKGLEAEKDQPYTVEKSKLMKQTHIVQDQNKQERKDQKRYQKTEENILAQNVEGTDNEKRILLKKQKEKQIDNRELTPIREFENIPITKKQKKQENEVLNQEQAELSNQEK